MKTVRTIAAGLALLSGVAIVYSSQPTAQAVASDYLVRPAVVAKEATSQTLSDWEYTGRNREAKCRGIR